MRKRCLIHSVCLTINDSMPCHRYMHASNCSATQFMDLLLATCYFPLTFSIYRLTESVRITFSTYHPVTKSPFVESIFTTFCSLSFAVFCLIGTTEWQKEICCAEEEKKIIRPVPELMQHCRHHCSDHELSQPSRKLTGPHLHCT